MDSGVTNDKENMDDFLNSYITLKGILQPNLSERKQNFLDLFINILIMQINSYSTYILSKENSKKNNIIQENILKLSKEISKLLSHTKENETLLMYNNIINFSLNAKKRKFSTSTFQKKYLTNKSNTLNIQKKIMQKDNHNFSLNKSPSHIQKKPSPSENVIKIYKKNRNISVNNSDKNYTIPKFEHSKISPIYKQVTKEEEIKEIKNNSMNDIIRNTDDKKTIFNNKFSSNNSIEKITFTTTGDNHTLKTENKNKIRGKSSELIINNEKIGIKAYEEITNRPSTYAKYLVKKYKDVVDSYEKQKLSSNSKSNKSLKKK
jgi:hypothetical protein